MKVYSVVLVVDEINKPYLTNTWEQEVKLGGIYTTDMDSGFQRSAVVKITEWE